MWRRPGNHEARDVAIKCIRDDSHDIRQAAIEEAELMHGLHHPGIVRLLGITITRGQVSIVTEYMEGRSLDRVSPHKALHCTRHAM